MHWHGANRKLDAKEQSHNHRPKIATLCRSSSRTIRRWASEEEPLPMPVPIGVSSLHLQPRDGQVLALLAELGCLDLNTLAQRLFGGSIRACQRRMQLLVAHELVHPMSPTVTFTFGHAGRLATIFRLTARGAEVLATFTGQLIARPRRLQQRPETLLHSLEIAQLQLAVNDACALRGLNEPAWMHELDTYPDLAARTKRRKQEGKALPATDRFVLLERFTLANGRTATCWPDASCRLAIPADDGTVHTLIIAG